MKFVIIVVVGVTIFGLLKVLRWLLSKIQRPIPYFGKAGKAHPSIELFLWATFVFLSLGWFGSGYLAYPYLMAALLMMVVALFAWVFFRDFSRGILFKIQRRIHLGDFIRSESFSGQIKSSHLTHVMLLTENGKTIKVPYSQLNKGILSKLTSAKVLEPSVIHMKFKNTLSKKETEKAIRDQLAQSPWCQFAFPPKLRLKEEDQNCYHYEIQVSTLNSRHLKHVERGLSKNFESFACD